MKIVIVGSGLSGWLTALALGPFVGSVISELRVLNVGTYEEVPPVLLALPAAISILERLSIAQTDLLLDAGASFHLGHAFSGWQNDGKTHFVGVGETKAPLGPVSLAQLALRASPRDNPISLSDYSLEALCAQAGRFAFAMPDPRSVLSTLVHGLHIETGGLLDLIKRQALALGVREEPIELNSVMRGDNGNIQQIQCTDGRFIEGDLFVDCTGSRRLLTASRLIDLSLNWPAFELNWSSQVRVDGNLPLCVLSEATDRGWTNRLSTQNNSYELDAKFSAKPSSQLGRLQEIWHNNCISIGSSAVCLPPSAGLELHSILSGIDLLLRLLPTSTSHDTEATEYNRVFGAQLDQAHAWAALPFARNQRSDGAHWHKARALSELPLLAPIIHAWSRLGRIARLDNDWFEESAWLSMLWGSGTLPTKYDLVANTISDAEIRAHLSKVHDTILAGVNRLPLHDHYIASVIAHVKAEQSA